MLKFKSIVRVAQLAQLAAILVSQAAKLMIIAQIFTASSTFANFAIVAFAPSYLAGRA